MKQTHRTTIDELRASNLSKTVAVTTPRHAERVRGLGVPVRTLDEALAEAEETLLVVGGGTLIDRVKWERFQRRPTLGLIAVPSIWGSGAEANSIAVLDDEGRKEIHVEPTLCPDTRVVWPELAESVPPDRARAAAGDVWAHALEAFLSPLAKDPLREALAALLRELVDLDPTPSAEWFDPSAEAGRLQSCASVGLVHGFAHALEASARAALPDADIGHARLCATFLWPVASFNREASSTWNDLFTAHDLPADRVLERTRELFDPELYARLLPLVKEHYKQILRDPCTRTNSALVRRSSLDFFTQWSAS